MKATGIVRRIDELGRVVIPKELRRTLHFREGEELEIYTDDREGLILRKFSPIKRAGEFAEEYVQVLYEVSGHTVLVCDKDKIVAAAGEKRNQYIEKFILHKVHKLLDYKKAMNLSGSDALSIVGESADDYKGVIIVPIILGGDILGAVIMISHKNRLEESELKICEAAALFLAYQA